MVKHVFRTICCTVALALMIGLCGQTNAAAQTWPNEPSGSSLLNDYNWNSVPGGGWLCAFGCGTITSDATAPQSPSSVLTFTLNPSTGYGGGDPYFDHTDVPEIYNGYWIKASNPFQSIINGQNKISFTWQEARDGQWVLLMVGPALGFGPYGLNMLLEVAGSNPQSVNNCHLPGYGDCPGSYIVGPNVSNPTFTVGVWHRIEIYGKTSTTNSSRDGILRLWFDGQLVMNYTNVNTPRRRFSDFQFTPTWDGPPGFTNPNRWYFDHVRISAPNGAGVPKSDTTPPASPTNLRVN